MHLQQAQVTCEYASSTDFAFVGAVEILTLRLGSIFREFVSQDGSISAYGRCIL